MPPDTTMCGQTPREFGRKYRLSPDRVRRLIVTGELGALDVSVCRARGPRYIITPAHAAAWERSRQAATEAPAPQRRRRQTVVTDYYPGD